MPRKSRTTRRPRVGPSIKLYQRDGSDRWWCCFWLDGKRIRRSTGTADRGDAEAAALALHEEAADAARRAARRTGTVDLAALAGIDVTETLARGCSPQQVASVEHSWAHVCRVLGADTDPDDIDYDRVVAFIGQRRGEGVRGQSIRKEVQALKRGFKIARRRGWLDQDMPEWPVVRNDPPRRGSKGKLVRVPDLLQWLDALADEPKAKEARLQAELVLRTGLRSMEARRLCWSWVEPVPEGVDAAALLRVPAEAAKNRRERVLGLTPEALAILESVRRDHGIDEPLLPGSHVHAYQSASRKIGHRSITLRDLRHCHATWAAQGTGDAAAAQEALGHSDLRTTQRYLTATVDRVAGAAAAVGEKLSPGIEAGRGVDPEDDPPAQGGRRRPPWGGNRHSDRHSRRPGSAKTQVELVGETGFEPAASCSQSRCSTRLSYSPVAHA